MKYIKNSLLVLVMVFSFTATHAQVMFKLQLLNDGTTYQVSLVPEASYRPPMNMTSTAQVTIRVPSGSFDVQNLINLQPNVQWEANSLTQAPAEAEASDYISFGLATNGTDYLRYEEGIELPIFTFENALDCTGEVALVNNNEDPFMPPNTAQKNVGNQITIAGANGDAYAGNLTKTSIPCGALSTDVHELDRTTVNFEVFPNPASEMLNVSLDWQQSKEAIAISLFDTQGKKILTEMVNMLQGSNNHVLDISNLVQGTYLLELRGTDWKLNAGQFVKLEK